MKYNFCPTCGAKNDKPGDFKCLECNKSFYFNSKPTASIIPIYQNKEILVSIRKIDPAKGKLDIVGGFLKNGEDPLVGAVREFEEETGFKIDKEELELLSIEIDDYLYEGDTYYTFNVTYTTSFHEKLDLVPNDDVAELIWIGLDDLKDPAFPYQIKVMKDLKKKLN